MKRGNGTGENGGRVVPLAPPFVTLHPPFSSPVIIPRTVLTLRFCPYRIMMTNEMRKNEPGDKERLTVTSLVPHSSSSPSGRNGVTREANDEGSR